jgi:hypothetical protein
VIKIDAGNSARFRSSTSSASVIWPLANMVVLLTGLDAFEVSIKALSWCYQHRLGPLTKPSDLRLYARESAA